MDFILIIITVLGYGILLSSFFDIKWGVIIYISFLILVPYLQFGIGSFTLSYNLVNTVLLVFFIHKFKIKNNTRLNFKLLTPFVFLFGGLFLLTFFENSMPLDIQLNYWRIAVLQTSILPVIVWNVGLTDSKFVSNLKWTLIFSFTIACIYGVYLTQLGGNNPYTSFLAKYTNADVDYAEFFTKINEPRLSFSNAGKIQATMFHPMKWGINLCFIMVISFLLIYKEKRAIYILFILLLAFNLLVSGVRTGIAAIIVGAIYFVLKTGKLKTISVFILIASAVLILVLYNSDLKNIFNSFTQVSNASPNAIKGSSISMRINQLMGAIREIQGNELVGKGYGWTSYYHSLHGDHPVLLAFESLIFVILCNWGIIGCLIWIAFLIILFRVNRKVLNEKQNIVIADVIIIIYISYAIGTGEYGYIQIFALFYNILMLLLFQSESANALKKVILESLWEKKTPKL